MFEGGFNPLNNYTTYTALDVIRTYDLQVLAFCFHSLLVLLDLAFFLIFGDIDVGTALLKLIYLFMEQAKVRNFSYASNRKSGILQKTSRIYWNAIGVSNGVSGVIGIILELYVWVLRGFKALWLFSH